MTKFLGILTRHPERLADYFGFGARELERGKNKFGDAIVIATVSAEHADWNAMRLGSGLHGARVLDDAAALEKWKDEWGYVKES